MEYCQLQKFVHKFPILYILETRKCILPVFFTFIPEYDIRNIEEKNDRLILNRTHQVLGYADDVKLLNTTRRNTKVLIVIRNAVGLKQMQRKALWWIRSHRT